MRRIPWIHVVLIGLLSSVTRIVSHATPAEDYTALTGGIQTIALKGTAGSISVQGRNALPLIISPKKETIVAAGYIKDQPQNGRIVVTAHGSLLGVETGPKWQQNVASWASRKSQPAVLLLGLPDKDWTASDTKLIPSPKVWDANTLKAADVIVANIHAPSFRERVPVLLSFAEKGGGIVFLSTPWAAPKESLEGIRSLLESAGLALLNSGPTDSTFSIEPHLPAFSNALTAVEALVADQGGQPKLSASDREMCALVIESCIASKTISESLKNTLNSMHFARGWVTVAGDEILRRKSRPVDAMLARYQHLILEKLPPDKTPAHPSAEHFPGVVGPGAQVTRTVSFEATSGPNKLINHGEKTRISTGLYARPGVPIMIEIPAKAANAGLKVEIGIHTDQNWALSNWRRFPEISRISPLESVQTAAANAFGGLVSILLPENCNVGPVEATIKGAVEAPAFILGKTTESQWRTQVRNAPGAWGYIETPKWTGYFSSTFLRTVDNPEAIANYWQNVVNTADSILGYSSWRRRAESMTTDVDISVGYGHAGYPVLMAYAAEKEENQTALGRRGPEKGDWGFLHELGHTYQDSFDANYTIATHGEVDVNLVPALVINLIHGRTAWDNDSHSTFNASTRIADLQKWEALAESERTWARACKMNVAYDFYFTLAECFGWQLYQKAFSRWMNWLQKPGEDPDMDAIDSKNPNSKRDRFLLLFSQSSQRNLLPYFQKYGLGKADAGLSESVISKVSKFPVWNGNQPISEIKGPSEIRITKNLSSGATLATFKAVDPDQGSIITYKIKGAYDSNAVSLDSRTGKLVLVNPKLITKSTVTIEAQDNSIPLSTKEIQCRLMVE